MSTPIDRARDLARQALAPRLGEAAADALVARMSLRSLAVGDQLYSAQQPASTAWLLCDGALESVLPLGEGSLSLAEIQPGTWLGGIHLVDGGPAASTVRATEASTVLGFSRDQLARLEVEEPAVAAELLRLLVRDLAAGLRRCSTAGLSRDEDDHWRVSSAEHTARGLLGDLTGRTP